MATRRAPLPTRRILQNCGLFTKKFGLSFKVGSDKTKSNRFCLKEKRKNFKEQFSETLKAQPVDPERIVSLPDCAIKKRNSQKSVSNINIPKTRRQIQ